MTLNHALLKTLAQQQLKNASTGELVQFSSLWQEKPCVVIFFRRWGCVFCRLWATEISQMATQLSDNNIRLVGVGVEDLGLEDFVQGKYFAGELFVDVEKKAYKTMDFKRFSWLSILASLVSSEARAAVAKGKQEKLGGDFRGDGLQNGGALVVGAGGKELLLEFRQDRPAEHLPNARFLEVLGLTPSQPGGATGQAEVFAGECKLPEKK